MVFSYKCKSKNAMFFSAIVVTDSLVPLKVSKQTDTNKLHSQTIFSFFHSHLSLSLHKNQRLIGGQWGAEEEQSIFPFMQRHSKLFFELEV
jgi:hypothetical protein